MDISVSSMMAFWHRSFFLFKIHSSNLFDISLYIKAKHDLCSTLYHKIIAKISQVHLIYYLWLCYPKTECTVNFQIQVTTLTEKNNLNCYSNWTTHCSRPYLNLFSKTELLYHLITKSLFLHCHISFYK